MRVCSRKASKAVIRVTNQGAHRVRAFKPTAPTTMIGEVIVKTTVMMKGDSVPKDSGWDCSNLPTRAHSIVRAATATKTMLVDVAAIRHVRSTVPAIMMPKTWAKRAIPLVRHTADTMPVMAPMVPIAVATMPTTVALMATITITVVEAMATITAEEATMPIAEVMAMPVSRAMALPDRVALVAVMATVRSRHVAAMATTMAATSVSAPAITIPMPNTVSRNALSIRRKTMIPTSRCA